MQGVITITDTQKGYGHEKIWGTYEGDVTERDIAIKCGGWFGGHMISFGDGKFVYKAYDD